MGIFSAPRKNVFTEVEFTINDALNSLETSSNENKKAMTIFSENPRNIYTDVEAKISEVLSSLEASSKENRLQEEFRKASDILAPYAQKLKKEIRALEENAEWNTFVMAFYGETNAGKSTIIEALRILLKERSKAGEQEKFRALKEKFNITESRFAELQVAIEAAEHHLISSKINLKETDKKKQKILEEDEIAINSLMNKIDELKQTASIWQKLLRLFKKMPELRELDQLKESAGENRLTTEKEIIAAQEKIKNAEIKKQDAIADLHQAEIEKKNLEEYADGAIIGNGKSDFTLTTEEYRFSAHGQEFILLDVPGIEGNESKVIDSVHNAVKKAHAVFYVTGKAAPPQKGENGQKGTLEKIKEHLNAQTEVWSIFNKRVNNPIQIENGLLIGEDEQKSLDGLDVKMAEQLEANYKGTISLSAYPAFLAAANHLVPGSHHLNGKEKFTKKFSAKEILEKTKMNSFYKFIAGDLVKNAKTKIFHSNFTKAKCIVDEANGTIANILNNSMVPLQNKLTHDSENTREQLQIAFESLRSRIISSGDRVIDHFVETLREKMYRVIESNVSNDDFKSAFENRIKSEQASLTSDFPNQIGLETKRFESQIFKILERYKELAEDSIYACSHFKIEGIDAGLDLKIDIKNGINVPGLIGAAIGGVVMVWNPAGWAVLALSAITIIVSVIKAVRSFFSSDYKKSQQRESVNENLNKISGNMRSSMQTSLDSAFLKLEPKLEQLKLAVSEPLQQISGMVTILNQTKNHFKQIANDIDYQLKSELNANEGSIKKVA